MDPMPVIRVAALLTGAVMLVLFSYAMIKSIRNTRKRRPGHGDHLAAGGGASGGGNYTGPGDDRSSGDSGSSGGGDGGGY